MKANRKFRNGEEAVSAVIGVILMVAITVAIAATVYVYVSGMIGGTKSLAPTVQFTKLENDDRVLVATTDAGVTWDELAIRADQDVTIWINGEVSGTQGGALTTGTLTPITNTYITSATANIQGSDWIDIEGTSAALTDVTITIIHRDTNSILQTVLFSTVSQLA